MNRPSSPFDAPPAAAPASLGEPADIARILSALAAAAKQRGWRLGTAESCTGGLIAAACTSVAGSSDWFDEGVVTYSNAAKTRWLGVPAELIDVQGAVSEPVACAMVQGLLRRSVVDLAVAVTGIAGPGGGSPDKPVGSVWFAWAWRADDGEPAVMAEYHCFIGDRSAVREATVHHALQGLQRLCEQSLPSA